MMNRILTLALLGVLTGAAHAQTTLTHHGARDRALPMPTDGNTAVTQYAVRFSAPQGGEMLQRVDLWFDSIVGGATDETVSYHGPEAMFAWPVPFTHVPQTFLKQAVRFSAPGNGRLKSVDLFVGGGTASDDGFNDTLRVRVMPPIQTQNLTVKYGTESATNNPVWKFYIPVGTARTSYGTRYTAPASADSFRVNGVQFFIDGINDNSNLPVGNPVPDDTVRTRIWRVDATTKLPTTLLGERKTPMSAITLKAWNQVDLFQTGVYVRSGEDFAITFDMIAVGLADHMAFATAASNPTPLKRSLVLESGVWKTIDVSTAYAGGGAQNAELWTRALLLDPADAILAQNDPSTPNLNAPYAVVSVPLSSMTRNAWNTLVLPAAVDVAEDQDLWISAELVQVGAQDVLSMISHSAEPTPAFRSAAYIQTETGGSWRYLSNTQFGSEFIFRMRGLFQVNSATGITDDLILVLYGNGQDNLPGAFLNTAFVPLSSLNPGEVNAIDVSSWNHRLRAGEDVHIAVTAEFDVNPFALAADNGSPLAGRTSVFRPNDGGWSAYTRNLMMSAVVGVATSIEPDGDRAETTALHGAYPNPFNPTTVLGFHVGSHGHAPVRLAVYDLLGREVAVLVDAPMTPGAHSVTFDATGLASGVYLVRLQAGSESFTRLISLVK